MADQLTQAPECTAVRVALWRAMHVEVDAPPHVLDDTIGVQLVAPDDGWRARPDMDPDGTRGFRFNADAWHFSGSSPAGRYFSDRTDELRPSTEEDFVLATRT